MARQQGAGGPVAVVTGAGSGIGRATAILLAREGYRLALIGRTASRLEATAGSLAEEGIARERPLVLPADLAREEEASRVVEAVLGSWGRLDVLVNNAGWGSLRPIADTDLELLHGTFAVNFFSAAELIRRSWPVFVRQRAGCVVNVSSAAAHDPYPGFFAYAASKAALESLGRSIASEAAQLGMPDILAYSIAPGAVETPLLRSAFSEEVIPREKTLDPFEVAERIRECVLGKAAVKNGGTIIVPSPL